MKKAWERLYNGVIKENPVFVLMLGMCPTLAVTTAAMNGLCMGLSTLAVLVMSNVLISALRKVIPDNVRMPAFIVIVATFVTLVQMIMQAYMVSLYRTLGIYIPLIVVNCIILGRAEAYASKNTVWSSLFDGLGMGIGFTVALTILGAVRELFGTGTLFGATIIPESIDKLSILALAPGAFFVLAILCAIQNKLHAPSASNVDKNSLPCGGHCAGCTAHCRHTSDAAVAAIEQAAKPDKKAADKPSEPAKPPAEDTPDEPADDGEGAIE